MSDNIRSFEFDRCEVPSSFLGSPANEGSFEVCVKSCQLKYFSKFLLMNFSEQISI